MLNHYRGFRCYVFLSCFFFVMVFICFLRKKSLELFWKILMNFLKSPYEFLEKSLWIYLKNPYGFFYCYGFSSSFFFAKSKKTITIKKSIWFFLKNSYGFFLDSYGFLLKIRKDFSEIYRVFFTKTITKKKTDKKSVVPEPSHMNFQKKTIWI